MRVWLARDRGAACMLRRRRVRGIRRWRESPSLGSRDVVLDCSDDSLRAALEAELRSRLAVRVGRAAKAGPEVMIRLSPGIVFLQAVRALPKPSLVAVVSACERVHRLVSSAVLIHGGEGVAYVPATGGNRDSVARARRLAGLIAADYASLPWAQHRLPAPVIPLALISAHSWTELTVLLRRRGPGSRRVARPGEYVERSLQTECRRSLIRCGESSIIGAR